MSEYQAEAELLESSELYRMRMTAICVISNCNTKDSFDRNYIPMGNPYWTPAYEDTADAVRREIALIAARKGGDE